MDLNVWIVILVMFLISVSHGTMFSGSCCTSTVDDMCDCMNMMTIDCMLPRRRGKKLKLRRQLVAMM